MLQYLSKKVNKVITLNRELIPKQLKEVLFIKKNGAFLYDFYDMEKVSISNEIMEVAFDDTTLYNYITSRISEVLSKDSSISENTEYIFNVGWKYRNVHNYFDRTKFIELRHKAKLNHADLSFRINISRESIYMIEKGEVKNVRSDMVLKYALFFRKPISYFLKNEYKEKLADIDADFIMDSNSISLEQKENILAHFLK